MKNLTIARQLIFRLFASASQPPQAQAVFHLNCVHTALSLCGWCIGEVYSRAYLPLSHYLSFKFISLSTFHFINLLDVRMKKLFQKPIHRSIPHRVTKASKMADESQTSQDSQDSVRTILPDRTSEILYFAYGSNLSTEQMHERCPHATPVGIGHLQGWRWIINTRGYANVVKCTDDESQGVWGMLYLLPPRDEDTLDKFEGVPWAYDKHVLEVRWALDDLKKTPDGGEQMVRALVYVDEERRDSGKPRGEYVGRMERGIEDAVGWGLGEEYVERVMRPALSREALESEASQ